MDTAHTDTRQGPAAWTTVLVMITGLVLIGAGVVIRSGWLTVTGLVVLAVSIPIGLVLRGRGGGGLPGWSDPTTGEDVAAAARAPDQPAAQAMDLPPGNARGHLSAGREPVSPPPGAQGLGALEDVPPPRPASPATAHGPVAGPAGNIDPGSHGRTRS